MSNNCVLCVNIISYVLCCDFHTIKGSIHTLFMHGSIVCWFITVFRLCIMWDHVHRSTRIVDVDIRHVRSVLNEYDHCSHPQRGLYAVRVIPMTLLDYVLTIILLLLLLCYYYYYSSSRRCSSLVV